MSAYDMIIMNAVENVAFNAHQRDWLRRHSWISDPFGTQTAQRTETGKQIVMNAIRKKAADV